MCAIDLGTFIANQRYHYDEESELRTLGPSVDAKAHWRSMEHDGACLVTVSASHLSHRHAWATRERWLEVSATFESPWSARVAA